VLTALFDTLNKCNGIELNFQRQNFQHYNAFLGKGNNSQLINKIFKNSRWWWNIHEAVVYDEDHNAIGKVTD
jgi:hypothetical protein